MSRPLAIDLFTGLHGWSAGLVEAGWQVIGFDIEDMCGKFGVPRPEHVQLVIQDVLTIDGAKFRDAGLIVASPPCQEFSYMAMPWTRAKQIARALRGEDEFPEGYRGSRTVAELTALFDACFRIQREACAAAGRHIPMVIENVKGAQPWVGRARWNYGSFFLWGDVPALMPMAVAAQKFNPDGSRHGQGSWFAIADSKSRGAGGIKQGGNWFNDSSPGTLRSHSGSAGRKQPGISGQRKNGKGDAWFQDGAAAHGSKSTARKLASAMIAKIPFDLAHHVAQTYSPRKEVA